MNLDQSEVFERLRSFPISGLRALSREREISVVGPYAQVLAEVLAPGRTTELPGGFLAQPGLRLVRTRPAQVRRPRVSAVEDATELLVVLDLDWAASAIKDVNLLRNICVRARAGVLFPIHFDWEPLRVHWGDGFSWPEEKNEQRWIWCSAPECAQASMTIINSTHETMSLMLNFRCAVACNRPVSMSILHDGSKLAEFESDQAGSYAVEVRPGPNEFLWVGQCAPVKHADRPRSLSFAILDLRLGDGDGHEILSSEAVYRSQDDASPRQSEIHVRRQLHRAGFVSVAGAIRSVGAFRGGALMATTRGGPSLATPYDADCGGRYVAVDSIPKHALVWMLASPLVGASFDALKAGLFADA